MKIYAVLWKNKPTGKIHLVTTRGWTGSPEKTHGTLMLALSSEEFENLLREFAFRNDLENNPESNFFKVELDV